MQHLSEDFPVRELQIDHRIPFEIIGDDRNVPENPDDYMLLSVSANRAKSWSCENCKNWQNRNIKKCQSCYWAFPENYSHIAMREIRCLDILWANNEIIEYNDLKQEAEKVQQELPEFVKNVLRLRFKKEQNS